MSGMSVLQEAESLINGDRAQTYGDARESFGRIAGLWSAYLGTDVTALDVTNMMILLKVSRTKGTFHRDSYVDIGGYAGLGERLKPETNPEPEPRQARVWGWFEDIPRETKFNTVLKHFTYRIGLDGNLYYTDENDSCWRKSCAGILTSNYAPFTEVLK